MDIEEKYNLLIIGGGPAAVKFLYNLLRTSKLPSYMDDIAIIEINKTFGSGNFENKVTYANYPATEYTKLVYFHETNQVISICNDVIQTQVYKTLLQYGDKYPPKSLVGYFMRLLGNVLLKHIYSLKKKLIFKPNREAIGIRLLTDGWFQIRTQCMDAPIKDKYRTIKAKYVVLCTGREQLQGDKFCQEQGLIDLLKINPSGILGNGQRALECAELLLNGPIMYLNQEQISQLSSKMNQCVVCKSNKCHCFGSLVPPKYLWHMTDVVLPEYQQGQLLIQIQQNPRVYFKEANNDYMTIPKSQVGKQGQVNYLCGLRGRAKHLFLRILASQEKRVNLTKEECEVQIDARRSKCRDIEIRDSEGNLMVLFKYLELFHLDQRGRVTCDRGSVRNLYCYGSCCLSQQQIDEDCEDNNKSGDCSLGFEDCGMLQINLKSEQIMQWFDNNEYPLTAQSTEKMNDFDSDMSVHSEMIDTETVALNQLQQSLRKSRK